jgi:hypothetical protein
MTIFPEFEQQLRRLDQPATTGSTAAPPSAHRRRWWRRPAGVFPIVASVAVVVAVVALVAGLGGHDAPQPPSSPPSTPPLTRADRRAEMRYTGIAQRHADRLAVCQTRPANTLTGAPPRSLTARLAAIRQPGPALRLPGLLARNLRHLYVHHSRLVLRQHGNTYWLVTVAESGEGPLLTHACQTATVAALQHELPRIPARLRTSTMQLLRSQLRILARSFSPAVCLAVRYPAADVTTCSADIHQIDNDGLVTYYGRLTGVVPDGVASVTVHYHDPTTNAPLTVSAPVTDNVFATAIPPEISPARIGASNNPIITWNAADGRTLKRIDSARSIGVGSCGGRATHTKPTAKEVCGAG